MPPIVTMVNPQNMRRAIKGARRLLTRNLSRLSSRRSDSSSTTDRPSFLEWYGSKLETHPFLTKSITAGLIGGSGDITCQLIARGEVDRCGPLGGQNDVDGSHIWWDWKRTARFMMMGSGFVAPACHVWYGHLMRRFPGSSMSSVWKRTLLDNFAFFPCEVPIYFSILTCLEYASEGTGSSSSSSQRTLIDATNKQDDDLVSRIRKRVTFENCFHTLSVGWIVWIPANLVMFRFVQGKYQVLYANCVGFVWYAFLSWTTNKSDEGEWDRHEECAPASKEKFFSAPALAGTVVATSNGC
mmetsp:Transcript_9763/g.22430  ORF Transcript_9763/g.22430 Transcript_9763/m.22430 type:complete len:298 (+) Transcript_9763:127-1020(+)